MLLQFGVYNGKPFWLWIYFAQTMRVHIQYFAILIFSFP